MAQAPVAGRGTAAQLFIERPERLAAAWRRERFAALGKQQAPDTLLDSCVENFVRQLGFSLRGAPGAAWSRTRGVLRLSVVRGSLALHEEFMALRQCLLDALMVMEATPGEHEEVTAEIDRALQSALVSLRRLENPALPLPRVPFGGLVVELIDPQPRPHAAAHAPAASAN